MEQEEATENFTPRDYQVSLMEVAIRQNTIIYLPTGSGKTFIAIMVLKHLSGSLTRPYSAGGKITLILVNSVALVDQHTKYVRDHTCFQVGAFSGEMNLDFWVKQEWEVQFNKYQVIIMTTQILVNIINSGFIDLQKVNLVIFDECHHGVDDQPMRQVMKNFQNLPEQPRILGLTATLLNGNCKLNKVMEKVEALESTYLSKVATVDGLEVVIGFSTNPQEKFKCAEAQKPSEHLTTIVSGLEHVVEILENFRFDNSEKNMKSSLLHNLEPLDPVDMLKDLRNLVKDLKLHIDLLGIFGGSVAATCHMIQIERLKIHCQDLKLLSILNYVLTSVAFCRTRLNNLMKGAKPDEKVKLFSSLKVLRLLEILREFKTISKEELCCIIFVQRRFTAKVIHHILDSLRTNDSDFYHLRTNFVVGLRNNPYKDTRENLFITKKNREVLESFVNKEINILVSSNVLEEGVDIPKCTLVVKFDKSEDYRSYIQSKGRARHKSSLYYTIIDGDVRKYAQKYSSYQQVEKLLNDFLVGKNEQRHSIDNDVSKMFQEDLIEPYFVNGPNSAKVDMLSAIPLLCRYCSSLARDQYTIYSPEWYCEKSTIHKDKLRVVIYLPVVCPVFEPVKGPWMKNKKNAKRAAALNACILLHKSGELNDNLLPNEKTVVEEDISHLFTHWPEVKEASAGTKKKKRLHEKQIASSVHCSFDLWSLHLHIITLMPTYRRNSDADKGIIYDMYLRCPRFGVLSPKPLPDLCKFPIYDSNGEITVDIKMNVNVVTISDEQFMDLRGFHYLIFNDLLEILKSFLIFDNSGSNSDMLLVVPVGEDSTIDYDVVRNHKTLKAKQLEPTVNERLNLDVTEETYLHKVVSPWYRSQPTMYVVTRVCLEKTPLSDFPNQDYPNFMSYFEEKHSLKIWNKTQPLLLVKGLSKRLNCTKPRGREGKRKKEKRYEELEEYLIPELVVKQEFPASLWVQARFLPTILSRLSYLLNLRQLQLQIAREIGADRKYLENCPNLQLDIYLLDYIPTEAKFMVQSDTVAGTPHNEYLHLEPPSLLTRHYNKDFAVKKLESEYSWRNINEPKDLERDIKVTLTDIEYYEKFISTVTPKQNRLLKNESPKKNLPAIDYSMEFQPKELRILSIKFENQCPNLCEFYRALTAAEANDIVNLERLETLGDSFLKLISSLYIVCKFPKYSEGKSTAVKGRLVSNKNLYYLATRKDLGGILKNRDLSPNDSWTPPCFTVPLSIKASILNKDVSINSLFNLNVEPEEQISGILSPESLADVIIPEKTDDEENTYGSMCSFLQKQYVSDKSLADAVEALLGAFFQSGGFTAGIKFVEWIGIIPPSENVQTLIDSVEVDPVMDKNATVAKIDYHNPQWQAIEESLGYHFRNRAFLLQALTHASYSPNRITQSYERLEFLGDAILDFLITCYIYEHCGRLEPGEVTDLRSALVNNNTFASLAVRCGFHKFLLMINSKLQDHIDKFVDYLASKNFVIDDEVMILLEEEDLDLAEYVDVPKVLGDVFEAIAGAVYLDSGKDLNTVWRVFYKIMWQEMELFSKNVPKNVNRRLYECHTAYPQYSKAVELENKKTMVSLTFMCEGRKKIVHGFGTNKILARRAAAKIALRSLKL